MKSEFGGGQLLISIGIVVVLGGLGLVSNYTARRAARNAIRTEAVHARYYLGEIANLHGIYRERTGRAPLNAGSGGSHPIPLPSALPTGLSGLTASSYNSATYARGTPLNIKATIAFDTTGLVSSFYNGSNLSYRPRTGAGEPFCSDYLFHSRSLREGICLADDPVGRLATGKGPGEGPEVRKYTGTEVIQTLDAYASIFSGGVRVALGDLNNDGYTDLVTAAGPGGGPHVNVISGRDQSILFTFYAYHSDNGILPFQAVPEEYHGGAFVAIGDIDGDGQEEVITGSGEDHSPIVRIFKAPSNIPARAFYAYDPGFRGGVRVATGDVDGDGIKEIITGPGPDLDGTPPTQEPVIRVFNGSTGQQLTGPAREFHAYDPSVLQGVFVASGDVNRDGLDDIITGVGPGNISPVGGPHVRIISSNNSAFTELFGVTPYPGFTGGVQVGSTDYNQDGYADIITGAGPGGGPHVKIYSGNGFDLLHHFFAFPMTLTGGVFVGGYDP